MDQVGTQTLTIEPLASFIATITMKLLENKEDFAAYSCRNQILDTEAEI